MCMLVKEAVGCAAGLSLALTTQVSVQVEVHGSGFAESRIGYEAFRLNFYSSNSVLGWGRLVVELLFVVLCIASFITDLGPIITRKSGLQRQSWSRYARSRTQNPLPLRLLCHMHAAHALPSSCWLLG